LSAVYDLDRVTISHESSIPGNDRGTSPLIYHIGMYAFDLKHDEYRISMKIIAVSKEQKESWIGDFIKAHAEAINILQKNRGNALQKIHF
jgi:hypothetical protein